MLEHPHAFCTRQSLSKGNICFSEMLFSMHSLVAVYNSNVHCLLFILGYWLEFTTAVYIVYCLCWGTGWSLQQRCALFVLQYWVVFTTVMCIACATVLVLAVGAKLDFFFLILFLYWLLFYFVVKVQAGIFILL